MQLKCCTQQNNYHIPDLAQDYCNLQDWSVNVRMCTLFFYVFFMPFSNVTCTSITMLLYFAYRISGIFPWDKQSVHEQRWKMYIFFFSFFPNILNNFVILVHLHVFYLPGISYILASVLLSCGSVNTMNCIQFIPSLVQVHSLIWVFCQFECVFFHFT